jgi:FAD dependent oxidoreductase
MEKSDVIIIGAGIAGLSAALASVRKGLKTILVEKNNYSGGIAKDCFHTYICGLFKNDNYNPFQLANKGICSEVFNTLHHHYGDQCLVKLGKVETLAFKQQDLWDFFIKNLNQKLKFSYLKNSKCMEVFSDDQKISGIQLLTDNNQTTLTAEAFIDATGGSLLSDKSCNTESITKNSQLGGFCMLLKGPQDKTLPLAVPYTARSIVERYNLDNYLKYVTITHNFLTNHHILKFSVEKTEDITKCEFIFEKLKQDIKQLSNLEFIKSSKTIHLRSGLYSSDIDKTYENKNDDTDSACVKSFWPVEKWDRDKGPQYEYINKDTPFRIFSSDLKDARFQNLFLAGKSIRVPERTNSSARVMGVSMATGEQALVNAFNYLKEI